MYFDVLPNQLEYLEVIPCGPTIFSQILTFPADQLSENLKFRLHFQYYELIGSIKAFDLIIHDMSREPTLLAYIFPTKNTYLGLRLKDDNLSSAWLNILKQFNNLMYLELHCNLNMVKILGKGSRWMLATFPQLTTIQMRIIDINKNTDQANLAVFLNAYNTIDIKVILPEGVPIHNNPGCVSSPLTNGNGVVFNCLKGRSGGLYEAKLQSETVDEGLRRTRTDEWTQSMYERHIAGDVFDNPMPLQANA